MNKRPVILLILVCFGCHLHAQTPSFLTDSLDSYIKRGMVNWKIPGVAIAVVENGKVIITKGYGVREAGKDDPVDKTTLFSIASNTKLFTASALALLAYQKKISLDSQVTKYLPGFELFDPASTALVTIRDLLSHRLGTKDYQGDFAAWDTDLTRQDVINRMRLLKPVYPFRQDFGYSNSGYVAAGEIIPRVSGLSWEKYIERKMLQPLQMNRTYTQVTDVEKLTNVAQPYTTCCNTDGGLMRVPLDNLDNLGPAAGMVSNVEDMSHWLAMQLDSGRYGGQQVLPWSVVSQTRDPNTIASSQRMTTFPLGFQFYCLGTGLLDYAGRSVFAHRGGAFGYRSNVTFVPATKLGIVILTNQDNNNFHEALRFQILDAYFGVPYTDRSAYYLKGARKKELKNQQELKTMAERVNRKTKPVLPLIKFTGTYKNSFYGTITIDQSAEQVTKQQLTICFQHHGNLTALLDYMDGKDFRLSFSNVRFGVFPVTFVQSGDTIQTIEIRGTEFVDNDSYNFERVNP